MILSKKSNPKNSFLEKINIFLPTKKTNYPQENNAPNINNNINKNGNRKNEINNNINEKYRNTIACNSFKDKLNLFNNNKEELNKNPKPINKNNENKFNEANKVELKLKIKENDNYNFNKENTLTFPNKSQSQNVYLHNTEDNIEMPKKKILNYKKEELNLNIQVNKEKKEENPRIDNNSSVKKQSSNELKKKNEEQLEPTSSEHLNESSKNTYEINNSNFNIIYLIDTTLSMKKYENFITNIYKYEDWICLI